MRRLIPTLLLLLGIQLMLALALAMRKDALTANNSDTALIPATLAGVDHIVLDGATVAAGSPGAPSHVELAKSNSGWALPGYFDAPADAAKISSLVEQLTRLKRGLPVATSAGALRRFKVDDQAFERRLVFSQGGKVIASLYIGDSSGVRRSNARTADDHAVYSVDLGSYELPAQPDAWLDQNLLKRNADKLTSIDVEYGPRDHIELQRTKASDAQGFRWSDPTLQAGKALNVTRADALLRDVTQLRVQRVLGTEPDPDWQQDHPALRLAIKDDQPRSALWTLSKPGTGDFYVLKSSDHPWFLAISTADAKQLLEDGGSGALIAAATAPAATTTPGPAKSGANNAHTAPRAAAVDSAH